MLQKHPRNSFLLLLSVSKCKPLYHLFLQHVVFSTCHLIDFAVPDVPESLELKIKRERYLAKQALADTEGLITVRHI